MWGMSGKDTQTPDKSVVIDKNGKAVIATSNSDGSVKRAESGQLLPGSVLNPRGASVGQSIIHFVNQMADWPVAQWKKITKDKSVPGKQRIAAKWLIRIECDEKTKGGTYIATTELQHLFDRTVGRPSQAIEIQSEHKETHTLTLLNAINEE